MLTIKFDHRKYRVLLTDGALVLVEAQIKGLPESSGVYEAAIGAVANLGCELVSARCSAIRGQANARAMLGFADKLLARLNPPMGKAAKVRLIKGAYADFGKGLARKAVRS